MGPMRIRYSATSVLVAFLGLALVPGRVAAESPMYVGSEMCLSCHQEYTGWRNTLHATGLKSAANDAFSMQLRHGVVADVDGNGVDDFKQGLDLNLVSSAFDKYRPNAPVLGYDAAGGYKIRIGQTELPVRFAYGGSGVHRQLYAVKIPVVDRADRQSAGHYMSPVQYNEATHQYAPYMPEAWYAPDGSPRITPVTATLDLPEQASFEKKCAGCHFTGITVIREGNEWLATAPPTVHYFEGDPHYVDLDGDGYKEQVNVGCERCHGPGGKHVLGGGARDMIINPAEDFSAEQANELCGSCHAAGNSHSDGMLDYPFDEAAQQPYATNLGASLFEQFFVNAPALWPKGDESRQPHQQFQDMRSSTKWDAGVRCSDCHDVHLDNPRQIRPVMSVDDSAGNTILVPTRVEDNTQCLACHAGKDSFARLRPEDLLDLATNGAIIAEVVSEHTHHLYSPEDGVGRSLCTECHMAKVATNAIDYDTASHTFRVIPPDQTLSTQQSGGMPNSCAVRCHRQWAPIFGLPIDTNVSDWTEESDIRVAEWLRPYFGPAGSWWRTLLTGRTATSGTGARSRRAGDRSR